LQHPHVDSHLQDVTPVAGRNNSNAKRLRFVRPIAKELIYVFWVWHDIDPCWKQREEVSDAQL
jgi:hypothetical protein